MTEPAHPIRVLVVEDSAVFRDLLVRILESDPALKVVACVNDGAEAITTMGRVKPDVITMDIHMPGMDGYVATRHIMETQPVPIVIVTASYQPDDVAKSFRALEAGAVALIEKPPGIGAPTHAECARRLIDTVKAMAGVRVVRRWSRTRMAAPVVAIPARADGVQPELIAIGASTGGPPVLQTILAALPKPFPLPIVIVQHIAAGFVQGLADWLTQSAGMPVRIARDAERALPGHAYLAPDGCQMRVARGGVISCLPGEPENGLCPAVACLFRSLADAYGPRAVGILLTGMGRDGASELKLMRDHGAVTIAQDKASSVIHGMPGVAVELGAAIHIVPPDQIAALLRSFVSPPKLSEP